MLLRPLLTLATLALASPVLADAAIYTGTLGTSRIVLELSAPLDAAAAKVVGRYAYMNKGIDIPLDAVAAAAGKLDLAEEKPCTSDICHTDDDGNPVGPAPLGARWHLAAGTDGAVTGKWSSGAKSLPVSLRLVGTRPLPDGFDGTTLMLKAIVDDLDDGQKPIAPGVSPYDYIKLHEGPVTASDVTTTPGGAYQYVKDLRTGFAYPNVTDRNGEDVAAVDAYLEQRHWQMNLAALDCEAQQFQGLGWNELISNAVGTLGGYDDETVKVTYLSPKLLSWDESGSLFCGGAHPDNHDTPVTFDLATGKPLDLSLIIKDWVPTPFDDSKPKDVATARANPDDYGWGPDQVLIDFIMAHLPDGADAGAVAGSDDENGCGEANAVEDNLAISFLKGDRVRFSLADMPSVAAACNGPLFDLPIAAIRPFLTPGAADYFPSLGSH